MTSSSVEVSSPMKCDNGPPSLGITMLELADQLVLVVTAFPTPGRLESIRTGEPVLLILTPILALSLEIKPVLLILTPILILALSLEINDSNSCGVTFEESTLLIV